MGKLLRKAKKSARTNEPLFALKEIQALYNERKKKDLDLDGIAYAVHMSNCTLSKLLAQNSSVITVFDEYTSKEKKVLSKALHDSYLSLKKPSEDKIDKFRKIADLKAKEQSGQKMTMKSYNLVPMNFCEQKKSIFLFENFRWLYDVLEKKEIVFQDILKESRFYDLWNSLYPGIKIDKDSDMYNRVIDPDAYKDLEFALFKSTSPNDPKEWLDRVYDRLHRYSVDEITPEWSLFFTIVGYLLGFNSTFLEGKNVHPILFNGVGGVDFRVEHIRMKLMWLYDNESFDIDNKVIYDLIVDPYKDIDKLKSFCDTYKVNIKALQGIPQNLIVDENYTKDTTWSTMKFKSILRNSDKFIMKV